MTLLVVGALALVVHGCGSLTAGGVGSADVSVSGDAPESSSQVSSASPRLATTWAGSPAYQLESALGASGAAVQGQVEATLRVYLLDADGNRTALVGQDRQTQVDVQGQNEENLGATELDVGLYPRMLVVFTEVHANIESGLVIDGQSVTGRIDVGGDDFDSLVVEQTVNVEIREGQRAELLVDLNSTSWLSSANTVLMTVAESIFRQAVSLRVR